MLPLLLYGSAVKVIAKLTLIVAVVLGVLFVLADAGFLTDMLKSLIGL